MSMDENSTAFGRIMQPDSENKPDYDSRMVKNPSNAKAILWGNVQSLMQEKYGKDNLWAFCKFVGIGPGTGQRIKEQETSVGMDVIEKIADKFELQPWHLLVPNLDPRNPPVVLVSDVEQRFYSSLKESAKAFANVNPVKRDPDPKHESLWIEGASNERRKVPR